MIWWGTDTGDYLLTDFLHRHHVEEGGSIRIIQKLQTGMIVGVQGERFALGNEIADRIQV